MLTVGDIVTFQGVWQRPRWWQLKRWYRYLRRPAARPLKQFVVTRSST